MAGGSEAHGHFVCGMVRGTTAEAEDSIAGSNEAINWEIEAKVAAIKSTNKKEGSVGEERDRKKGKKVVVIDQRTA